MAESFLPQSFQVHWMWSTFHIITTSNLCTWYTA